MANPIFDFSHLSPEERIQLAEALWDSLEPGSVPVHSELASHLEERLRRHREVPDRARPAEDDLSELEKRGR